LPCLCFVAVTLTGCRTAPKDRPAPTASIPSGEASSPFWSDPNSSRNPGTVSIPNGNSTQADPVSLPGNDPEISGILAGKLVDGYGRAPGLAYVQVSIIKDGRSEPIADVETVSQGHFYIRGLQPGRTYKLVARTRQEGGHMLVGEVQARPPETRLLIPLGEELAGSATPPMPPPPGPPSANARPQANPRAVPPPSPPWDAGPAAGLAAPKLGAPEYGSADQIAANNPVGPPRISLPQPAPVSPIQPQSYATAPTTPNHPPAGPACVVSGGRVVSLRLPDADGREWDFAQRRGRLVLLDFWGTWCVPCLRAVPEVNRLHTTYSSSGLEVVGIACERGTPAENAGKVRATRQRLNIGYRLVLVDTQGSSVEQQFRVVALPTLVLIDSDGTILWRGSPEQIRELDGIIRRRLGN
jgi:thiol-disulfide isomerase/thioredoxin